MTKKNEQLGMHASTAQNRLVKDILWKLLIDTEQTACCKCGKPMCRKTFSIEHIVPWLDSADPVGLFFDLENISFSHLRCNLADARKTNKWEDQEAYQEYARQKDAERMRKAYTTEKRRVKYAKEKLKRQ